MADHINSGAALSDVVWSQNGLDIGSERGTAGSNLEDVLTIGILAREFNVTLRAIRFYETKGLLKPHREGKVRIYSSEDRERLALILKGKHLGFTLSEIRALIASRIDSSGHDSEIGPLGLSREQCARQIETLERQKRDIEDAIAELRRVVAGGDGRMPPPRLAAGS